MVMEVSDEPEYVRQSLDAGPSDSAEREQARALVGIWEELQRLNDSVEQLVDDEMFEQSVQDEVSE